MKRQKQLTTENMLPGLIRTTVGKVLWTDEESKVKLSEQKLFFLHPHGKIWLGDSIEWLQTLPDSSVDLVFADPPYNIKKAEWDTFESQQAYVEWSILWIEQAARVLKPNGTLFICGFSEILADLKLPASRFFRGCRWIVWHYKNKANLGSDWGRSHESILHFRKSKDFTFNIDQVRIPYGDHTLKSLRVVFPAACGVIWRDERIYSQKSQCYRSHLSSGTTRKISTGSI